MKASIPARANTFDEALSRERCRRYRRRILDISQQVSALHIGSAYSCTEIVDCIYAALMRKTADGALRDTFLMSKGHGCMIQYVILEELGILSRADLDAYCTPGGRLGVHPTTATPASLPPPARWATASLWPAAWRWPRRAAGRGMSSTPC
jgi:transketolase